MKDKIVDEIIKENPEATVKDFNAEKWNLENKGSRYKFIEHYNGFNILQQIYNNKLFVIEDNENFHHATVNAAKKVIDTFLKSTNPCR